MPKSVPSLTRLQSILLFVWKKHWLVIVVAVLAFLVTTWWAAPWKGEHDQWWNAWEPIVTILTLAVAIIIWWVETVEAWERQLPKRLRVFFVHGEGAIKKPVMVCEDAVLVGDSDVRNWAFQLGKQMNQGKDLAVGTALQVLPPRVELVNGTLVCRYELRIELTKIPERVEGERDNRRDNQWILVRKSGQQDEWRRECEYPLDPPFQP